ncbi:MAG: hypothetical protein WBW74_00075, partial [Xanthobacteraceae bacterium]
RGDSRTATNGLRDRRVNGEDEFTTGSAAKHAAHPRGRPSARSLNARRAFIAIRLSGRNNGAINWRPSAATGRGR